MKKKNSAWNNDYYTQKARRDDYRARSAYKLEEIDRKYNLFKRGDTVLDLGCAPGSWLQYVLKKIGTAGTAFGIDIQETAVPGATCFRADIRDFDISTLPACDAVISDMAPATTGNPFVDAQQSLELCRLAFGFAGTRLKPGGTFVCKIFQGEDVDNFYNELKKEFAAARRYKPASSRDRSRELFFIATGFKKKG